MLGKRCCGCAVLCAVRGIEGMRRNSVPISSRNNSIGVDKAFPPIARKEVILSPSVKKVKNYLMT